jgi:hypothetical protein
VVTVIGCKLDLSGLGYVPMAYCCEHSGTIKCGVILVTGENCHLVYELQNQGVDAISADDII